MAGLGFAGYQVTSKFQPNGGHRGLDFAVPTGTPIESPVSGTVVKVQKLDNSYGYNVRVQDDEGNTHYFAHLSKFGDVQPGQKISAGTVVGYSGSTGNSTGPHLHYEVRRGDNYDSQIDPMRYINGYSGTDEGASAVKPDKKLVASALMSSSPDERREKLMQSIASQRAAKASMDLSPVGAKTRMTVTNQFPYAGNNTQEKQEQKSLEEYAKSYVDQYNDSILLGWVKKLGGMSQLSNDDIAEMIVQAALTGNTSGNWMLDQAVKGFQGWLPSQM